MDDYRIRHYQFAIAEWNEDNFGKLKDVPQNRYRTLLGIGEEVGELMHAHLKEEQGIRGYNASRAYAEKCDALGDIFVYMCAYAHFNGIDLERAIHDTWEKVVSKRDWKERPDEG